jgi:transcriptional regulator with XRE-family HTH domain
MSNLGAIIKQRRELLGISQNELATKCDLKNGQFISNIERGACLASPKVIKAIAKAMRMRREVLIEYAVKDAEERYRGRF